MGAIKEKMKRDMEIRRFSARTRQTYLECATQFVKHFMKSPDQLTLDDIHQYQLHMIRECQYAENTFNLHVAFSRPGRGCSTEQGLSGSDDPNGKKEGGYQQISHYPYVAPHLCHPFARRWGRHS